MHAQDEVLDSFLFLSKAALLPSMGIASLKTTTYPCTLTPAPLHSRSNSPPQARLTPRSNAPQTIAPFSLPALRASLGYVYTLARSQPTATRTIVLSVRVGFTDSQQEGEVIDQDSTVILRQSAIREDVFRASGRGWEVCTSTSGGGVGSAAGCVVPRDPLVRDMSSPR